jgi:hypothetical protein
MSDRERLACPTTCAGRLAVRPTSPRGILILAAVALLAGCGGSSQHAAHVVTFDTAGAFPTATITGVYSVHNCERDTNTVVENARLFYVHSTGGIGPADLYFYDLRFAYATFQADGCSPGELGDALASKLTQRQRNFLIHNLSSNLATAFGAALKAR